jgi:hypothetical protein
MFHDEKSLRSTFTSKAGQVLPPLARILVDALGIEDDSGRIQVVGDGLARAFMEGTAVGATEMVAQAAEQGVSIDLNWLGCADES